MLVAVLIAFSWLHGAGFASGSGIQVATAHARTLQSVERVLHLEVELTANRWLGRHPALILLSVLIYRLYYLAPLTVLAWLFLRHPAVYLRARQTLVAMVGLALVIFWLLPTSPPRFALPGVTDIVADHDILSHPGGRDLSSGANYTAMPSLHVGWAAWCAYAIWSALRGSHPRLALLAWLFPLFMVAVVLGTGSHYVLDVVGSAVLLTVAVTIAAVWSRLLPSAPLP